MNRKLALFALLPFFAGCGGGSNSSPAGTLTAETLLTGIDSPSCIRFAPDGRLFITELTTGKVLISQNGTVLPTPFTTLPVATDGEQGLLSMALDPGYASNHFVYFCYSDSSAHCNRIVRFVDSSNVGINNTLIVDNLPIASNHNGGRIAFGPDGKLYMTIGENGNPANSQDMSAIQGKVLRLNPNGSIPDDNPITGNPMWAMGLRNSFGLAFQPSSGLPFVSENGPGCDDEINRIVKLGNYGWRPDQPCNDDDARFIQPLVRFNPTIAPTGIAFSTSDVYGFSGSLLMTSYNDGALRLFGVSDGAITSQQVLFKGMGNLFDVTQSPDGNIYFAGSEGIYRLGISHS